MTPSAHLAALSQLDLDALFVERGLEAGLLNATQVAEAKALQEQVAALGLNKTLAGIFTDRGVLTAEQVAIVMNAVQQAAMVSEIDTVDSGPSDPGEGEDAHEVTEIIDYSKAPAAGSRADSAPAIPGFAIERTLGTGGMGTVYLARRGGERVALKVLAPAMAKDEKYRKLFVREAKVARGLSHPNVVPILEAGKFGFWNYVVMEFVDGETLEQKLKSREQIKLKWCYEVFDQIAAGLSYIHQHGIIHRDIKPANILIRTDGTVKITDFGLARWDESSPAHEHSIAGRIVGTPTFMSPEQCEGKRGDVRSDIYCLGVTFYKMVCGKYPFFAPTPMAVMLKHLTEELTSPRVWNPDIPHPVANVLHQMLAKVPDERYQTVEDVIREMAAFREQKPIVAGGWSENFREAEVVNPSLDEDQIVEAFKLAEQLRDQGKFVPPIGELVRRIAPDAYEKRSFSPVERGISDVTCPRCKRVESIRYCLKKGNFRCDDCKKPTQLEIVPDVGMQRRGRVVLFRFGRSKPLTPNEQQNVIAAVGRLVELRVRSVAFVLVAGYRLERDEIAWMVEASDRVSEIAGSLSVVAPERVLRVMRDVGLETLVRLFETPEDFFAATDRSTSRRFLRAEPVE